MVLQLYLLIHSFNSAVSTLVLTVDVIYKSSSVEITSLLRSRVTSLSWQKFKTPYSYLPHLSPPFPFYLIAYTFGIFCGSAFILLDWLDIYILQIYWFFEANTSWGAKFLPDTFLSNFFVSGVTILFMEDKYIILIYLKFVVCVV